MTDGATRGLEEASPTGFVNGSATTPAGVVERRPTGRPSKTGTATPPPRRLDAGHEPAWGASVELWRRGAVASCRIMQALQLGSAALARGQLAWAEEASRRTWRVAQALSAEGDVERRAALAREYLGGSLEQALEGSGLLLDLAMQPVGEILAIMAEGTPPTDPILVGRAG